ncbi:alpha/beta fold hydrolase [Nocardia nova]|uniref:alpha/beta fold hydrolase n=1 Tax=Nocardia nova TaxID=37330 RepID=UPI003404C66E
MHGLLSDSQFWTPLMSHLAHQLPDNVTQIAYDARGHGSSHRPHRNNDTHLGVLANDLADVIDNSAGAIVLVAHSIGAYVVLEWARYHQRQLRQRVRDVVLFAAASEMPEWTALRRLSPPAATIRWMRRRPVLDSINAAGHAYLSRRLCAMASRAKPGRAQLVPSANPVDPRVTADICTAVTRFSLHPDSERALSHTSVRLVTAAFDRVVPPAQTQRLAQRLPDSHLEAVPDAGHSLPLVEPTAAASVIHAAAVGAMDTAGRAGT